MKTDSVPDLIALGMTEREAKLYSAMLAKPEWQSGELHRITGVPRVQTHRTLELMASRQYCTKRSEGRFNYYRATPPDILKEILVHRWEEEMVQKKQRAESTLDPLVNLYRDAMKKERSLDFIEIVQTPRRTHKRFTELVHSAEEEILGFNRSPYSYTREQDPAGMYEEQVEANQELINKPMNLRAITMYEEEYWDKYNQKMIKQMSDVNEEENRIIDYLPIKMYVYDRKKTLISLNSIPDEYGVEMSMVIVHDVNFAEACAFMFEAYWKMATPFEEWQEKLRKAKK